MWRLTFKAPPNSALDLHLFRCGKPLAKRPVGTKVTLLPVLEHGIDFFITSAQQVTICNAAFSKEEIAICQLKCRNEYATSPPVTVLYIKDIREGGEAVNSGGVTVQDVLDAVARRWSMPSEHSTDGQHDDDDFADGYNGERLSYYEEFTGIGRRC